MKELRSEVGRLKSDFEQKWSSQIKMVDANNRSVFKMHDKMVMLTDWLRSLGKTLPTRRRSLVFFFRLSRQNVRHNNSSNGYRNGFDGSIAK